MDLLTTTSDQKELKKFAVSSFVVVNKSSFAKKAQFVHCCLNSHSSYIVQRQCISLIVHSIDYQIVAQFSMVSNSLSIKQFNNYILMILTFHRLLKRGKKKVHVYIIMYMLIIVLMLMIVITGTHVLSEIARVDCSTCSPNVYMCTSV